ncbi:MAG: hypothetical protein R3F53_18475 [Gammaproteobacteria bacterium]
MMRPPCDLHNLLLGVSERLDQSRGVDGLVNLMQVLGGLPFGFSPVDKTEAIGRLSTQQYILRNRQMPGQ